MEVIDVHAGRRRELPVSHRHAEAARIREYRLDPVERYDLDQEGWEQREVYAKFGVAVYAAQVLEVEVVNHLISIRASQATADKPFAVDEAYNRLFRKTLGKNLTDVRKLLGEDWPLAERLAQALDDRNHLIHHFWRENILLATTQEGRMQLAERLDETATTLFDLDQHLTTLTLKNAERHGVTREWIENIAEQVLAGNVPADF